MVVDRLKELIKVNAAQVAPAEIEGVLTEHPSIRDAAVIGVPDESTGETPVAYVVADPEVSAADVTCWAAGRLAPYKRPSTVHFVERPPAHPVRQAAAPRAPALRARLIRLGDPADYIRRPSSR